MEIQKIDNSIISNLVLHGDVSKMDAAQRTSYYKSFCESLGLNPLTQPFKILRLNGKEQLYATKDATEQLRKIYGVSIYKLEKTIENGLCAFTAYARDKEGREDAATGAVNIEGLKGDALANAIMKAETKSKRRVTLSICGLGMLDETEVETIPDAQIVNDYAPAQTTNETIAKLHNEYIETLAKYEEVGGQMSDSLLPGNWQKREEKNYIAAINALKKQINVILDKEIAS